jgi:hypothetical protein
LEWGRCGVLWVVGGGGGVGWGGVGVQPENYWGTEGQYRAWRFLLPSDSAGPPGPGTAPSTPPAAGARLRTGAGPLPG